MDDRKFDSEREEFKWIMMQLSLSDKLYIWFYLQWLLARHAVRAWWQRLKI
jgi:hypothetical protein